MVGSVLGVLLGGSIIFCGRVFVFLYVGRVVYDVVFLWGVVFFLWCYVFFWRNVWVFDVWVVWDFDVGWNGGCGVGCGWEGGSEGE